MRTYTWLVFWGKCFNVEKKTIKKPFFILKTLAALH